MNALNQDHFDQSTPASAESGAAHLMLMRPSNWGGRRLAKTLSASENGGFESSKEVYHPSLFTRRADTFSNIEGLLKILETADQAGENFSYGLPSSAEIGAKPSPRGKLQAHGVVLPAKTTILLSDIENTPPMPGINSLLDATPEAVWKHLCDSDCVAEFQKGADVILHYSSSHGAEGSLCPRVHAFQLLDRELSLDWLSVLAGELKIEAVAGPDGKEVKIGCLDTSVLEKDRALWGSPVIGRGLKEDPFRERWFLIKGDRPHVEAPSVDILPAMAQAQLRRARELGAKGRGGRAGANDNLGDEVAHREWRPGGGWRQLFENLRVSGGHPLWHQVRKSCGSCIREHGDKPEIRAEWIGEVRSFLLEEVVHYDRSPTRVARVHSVANGLPILWKDIAFQHDWQATPRPERRLFPASTLTVEAARGMLASHVDMIVDDAMQKMGRADRVALAIAQIRDARAEADKLEDRARDLLEKSASQAEAAGEARSERATSRADQLLRRSSGLRRAAERHFKKGADLRDRARAFGIRSGVLITASEPGPDGVLETLIDLPPRASGLWPIAPSVGVGKTEAFVGRIEKLVDAGARVLVASGTQVLSESFEARLLAKYPGGLPFTLGTYRGEAQKDLANPGRNMCPRSDDRTALRLAGIEANTLCGSARRGWCPYKPRKRRPADAPPACQWLAQQDGLADADVVVMNCGPMLGEEIPAFMRRRAKGITKYDWIQRRPRTIFIERDDFDFIVIDEPSLERLDQLDTENADDDAKPEVCTHTLAGIRRADILQGPRPEIRPGWHQGLGPEQQDEDGGHKALAELLADLATATEALCAAAEKHGSLYGYLTYGELHDALGAMPDFQRRDRAHELANKAFAATQQPKNLGGADVVADWLGAGEGVLYAAWNRKMVFLHKLWISVAAALDRSRNAVGSRPNSYVKRVDIPAGRGQPRPPALAARQVGTLHKNLRRAPIAMLDATHRAELAGPHLGAVPQPIFSLIVPPAPGSCHVTVATDSSFSYSRLRSAVKAWKAVAGKEAAGAEGKLIRQIARWAARGAARAAGKGEIVDDDGRRVDALLIVPKLLEDTLNAYWDKHGGRPENLDIAHYGKLRGLDCWRGVHWCGVVGRMLLPLQASVDRANLLTGEVDQSPPREFIREIGHYDSRDPEWIWTLKGTQPRLPDPVAEACRAAACDDELDQAIGRLRLAQRPGAGVIIEVLTNHPVSRLPVDRFVKGADLLEADEPTNQQEANGDSQPPAPAGARRPAGYWARLSRKTGVPVETLRSKAVKD